MPPKTVTALEVDPQKVTQSEKLIGGLLLGIFVFVWLVSATSPFVFVIAILLHYYVLAAIIFIVTVAAYAPWEKGPIANAMHNANAYYVPRYFKNASMVFEGDHLPTSTDPQTFYAIHPHGAFCIGWGMLFCSDVLQHVRFCFAPFLYTSPFFRLFSRCIGKPGSASKSAMIESMKKGEHLALPPGGLEEATLTCTTQDRVFIKKRTGFIRLCLQHGIAVRPVYVFGEKSLFWNIQGSFSRRLAMNRYGLPAILSWGHPFFPLVPKSTFPVHIVVGSPLALPKLDNPSKADVTNWHNKYMAALTKLFEEHKEVAYGADAKTMKLEVW